VLDSNGSDKNSDFKIVQTAERAQQSLCTFEKVLRVEQSLNIPKNSKMPLIFDNILKKS
jgi:hypothetical protein